MSIMDQALRAAAAECDAKADRIAALEARCRELEADLAEETEAHDAWKKLCIEKEQRIAEIEKTGEDFFCRVAAGYPHVLADNQDVAQPFRICLGASTPEKTAPTGINTDQAAAAAGLRT